MNKTELLKKCISDFAFFCSLIKIPAFDYYKPPGTNKVIQPLIIKQFQADFIKYIQSPGEEKVVLKSRQLGFSTISLAYILYLLLYSKNQKILYAIDDLKKARDKTNEIFNMYNSLPDIIKPNIYKTAEIIKCRGNIFTAATVSKSTARSSTYTIAFVDEIAFVEPRLQDELMAALIPAAPTKRVFISTPRREDDIFHKLVNKHKKNNTLFECLLEDDNIKTQWFGSVSNAQIWLDMYKNSLPPAQYAREIQGLFRGATESPIWHVKDDFFVDTNIIPNIFSIDLGWSDKTAILFAGVKNNVLYITNEVVTEEETINNIYNKYLAKYTYSWGACDSAGKRVDITSSLSPHKQLQNLTNTKIYTHKRQREEMVQLAQQMFSSGLLKVSNKCENLIKMLYNYEYDHNNNIPRNEYKHIHDALCYLILNYLTKNKRKPTVSYTTHPLIN